MDQRNFHQTGNMIFVSGEELEYLGKSYNPGSGPPHLKFLCNPLICYITKLFGLS